MEEDLEFPIILGRPFLAIGRMLIDVQKRKLTLWVQNDQVSFNIFKVLSLLDEGDTCFRMDTLTSYTKEIVDEICSNQPLTVSMVDTSHSIDLEILEQVNYLKANSLIFIKRPFEDLGQRLPKLISFIEKPQDLELKPLPAQLKYAFLGEGSTLSVVISFNLTPEEEEKLLWVLREYKSALGWSIGDIKGISLSICMHKILLEEDAKPFIEHQRRLNPNMKEVV